jgi:6-pyruvoyltetrahydropterin/6-carboxytetrahydropterin synthase
VSGELLYLAAAPFEAAVSVPVLPEGHRSRGLHGHSFLASARAGAAADLLDQRLADAVQPLDYSYLNDRIAVPTDENLARWIAASLGDLDIRAVGVQSTPHQGVDIDGAGCAHLWRRFRFEAAHRLPRVAAGHPCGRMHGHGFEVILHVQQELAAADMGIDYDRLDELWRPLHAQLHHACLNDIAGLENPTSEMLACWLWQHLQPLLPELSWVTIYETVTAGCHYDGRHFRIWKEQRFESAVRLDAREDTRRRLHGHSYVTRLHLRAPLDQLLGWTIDYGDVREAFTPVFRQLDHQMLNESTATSAELPALLGWMREQCAASLHALDRIDLFETPARGAMLHWGEAGPALPGRMP